MADVLDKPTTTPAVKPAKGWRNLYAVTGESDDEVSFDDSQDLDGDYDVGVYWGRMAWPSRDTAETAAAEIIFAPWDEDDSPTAGITHLGAYPIETEGSKTE